MSCLGEDCHSKRSTNFLSTESAGVSKIETDVSAKTVVVEADESVAPEMMLEKLVKVS